MTLTVSKEGALWDENLGSGDSLIVKFVEMRRERTGIHGTVGVFLNQLCLAYDNFNLARREDRVRLGNDAHKALLDYAPTLNSIYSATTMRHDLAMLCRDVPDQWEKQLITIARVGDVEPQPHTFALRPYILHGGGTIFFAPPGSGKSYLLQAMSLAVATGINGLWETQAGPVLYINLERSETSLAIRDSALRKAMGIETSSPIDYVHARGGSLRQLTKALKVYREANPNTIAVLDSLSRAGMGNLNENETANNFVDLMNDIFQTWIAIGHTPRSNENHLYGSQHYDAGADIMVKVSSQSSDGMVGLCLEMVKANDIKKAPAQYLALEFDIEDHPITGIRLSGKVEFPELLSENSAQTRVTRITDHLLKVGNDTTKGIAETTGIDPSNVSKAIHAHPDRFIEVRRDGRSVFYRVMTSEKE